MGVKVKFQDGFVGVVSDAVAEILIGKKAAVPVGKVRPEKEPEKKAEGKGK